MVLFGIKKLYLNIRHATIYILIVIMLAIFPSQSVNAQNLLQKSVEIGSSRPSIATTNNFEFTIPGYTSIGSIQFEYCNNSPFAGTPCSIPEGLSVGGASLTAQSGETGFSIFSSTVNSIVLSRSSSPTSAVPVSYSFDNIINPDSTSETVYVRISTFASEDASGPRIDTGAVVFSTANNLIVRGYVPPYLKFCVGINVAIDCSSASGNRASFGNLSSSQARVATSQFSGATNDPNGYSVHLLGTTMTSGNNVIPAINSTDISRPSSNQFGMNLRANSNPGVGSEPEGSGSMAPVASMSLQNQFSFKDGVIASSSIATDYKRFTASYLTNISANQPPGIYSTTLTYVAVATF